MQKKERNACTHSPYLTKCILDLHEIQLDGNGCVVPSRVQSHLKPHPKVCQLQCSCMCSGSPNAQRIMRASINWDTGENAGRWLGQQDPQPINYKQFSSYNYDFTGFHNTCCSVMLWEMQILPTAVVLLPNSTT